jgi:hypothetical protein
VADVEFWLPFMAEHYPGSGITPFTVWGLEFRWWHIFRTRAEELRDAMKKQSDESKRRR